MYIVVTLRGSYVDEVNREKEEETVINSTNRLSNW